MRHKIVLFLQLLLLVFVFIPTAGWAWTGYLGIPDPWVDPDFANPSAPSPWTSEQAGYYYVDSTSGCSDANTYGHPGSLPGSARCTVPTTLAAGAYVSVQAGAGYTTPALWNLNGSSGNVVTVVGTGTPTFTGSNTEFNVRGSYWVVDGLKFVDSKLRYGSAGVDTQYIVWRNNTLTGWVEEWSHTSMHAFNGTDTGNHHLIFYKNHVYDNGEWTYNGEIDIDHHGFGLGAGNSYIWFYENDMDQNAGDGVQVNATSGYGDTTHHIYFGGNTYDNNLQCGIWVKEATDVIISTNYSENHTAKTWSPGAGFGQQYGPERVWYINNWSNNNDNGIRIATDSTQHGQYVYVIGNLITSPTVDGIDLWDYDYRFVIGNTIVGFGAEGISTSDGGMTTANIENNIIGSGGTTGLYWASVSGTAVMRNNIVATNSIEWAGHASETLAEFQSRTGLGQNCSTSMPTFNNAAGNDYTPAAGDTMLIDQGYTTPSAYGNFTAQYSLSILTDRNGVSLNQDANIDIGALQKAGAGGSSGSTVMSGAGTSVMSGSGSTVMQ